jgi:hypothetical protein
VTPPGNASRPTRGFVSVMLMPTTPAPPLSLPVTGGGSTDDLALGTGTDGRFTLVVFFRGLHCPVCRAQLSELDRRREDVAAAGVGRVVAISMETAERSASLVERWHLDALAVAHSLTEPGMVVLDADGTVFWTSVASTPFGRPPLDDVLAGLRLAQEAGYPVRGAA